MKGTIMDKKILLGGAAALLLVGNMYATPASAAIDLSIGGEAELTATMSDSCFTAANDTAVEELLEAVSGDTIDDQNGSELLAFLESADFGSRDISTYGTNPAATDDDNAVAYRQDPCGGASEDNPVLGFSKKLTIDASGTLANGLSVSFSDELNLADVDKEEGAFSLSLGGAFGTLTFKDNAASAVDAARVGDTSDITVTGADLGRHTRETSGTAGTGILWQAPSMGNLDMFVSWAPNADDSGFSTATYTDTFAFGAVFNADVITVGAGMESASANAAGACKDVTATDFDLGPNSEDVVASALIDAVYGGDYCGDQTLTFVGATMDAGEFTLSAAYSVLDTEEADKTVTSIGASTSVGEYDFAVDWTQREKAYQYDGQKDEQTVIGASVSTSLGDGVDLGFKFSNNDIDLVSQTGGNGSETNYNAEVALTVGF
jgi:hypothetical protein